jgi:hypothetical protein
VRSAARRTSPAGTFNNLRETGAFGHIFANWESMEEEKGRRRHGSQSAQPNPGPATRPSVSRPLKHGKESEDNSDEEFDQIGLQIMPGAEPEIADDGVDVSAGPPSFGQVVNFMLPTLGMLLANPILSMVDTSFVGRYNDKMALGALAPSTAACDQAVYLASFISVATVMPLSPLSLSLSFSLVCHTISRVMVEYRLAASHL